jgi:uridine kinase
MTLMIAITGGSGSGKSVLAAALAQAVPGSIVVCEDWYYRDAGALPDFDPATHDFDDLAARDHGLLIQDLEALKAGHAIVAPVYSFVTHRREPQGRLLSPAPVVIVEGAHLMCDPRLIDLFDLRVFVDTPADIRFIRRLLRDQAERGRSPASITAQYLATVRPGHERHTEPSRAFCDLIIIDGSAAVQLEDDEAGRRLLAPLLAHPLLARASFGTVNDRSSA